MAQKPVRWSLAARADLLEALEYIVEESPQAAADLLRQVEEAAASLGTFSEGAGGFDGQGPPGRRRDATRRGRLGTAGRVWPPGLPQNDRGVARAVPRRPGDLDRGDAASAEATQGRRRLWAGRAPPRAAPGAARPLFEAPLIPPDDSDLRCPFARLPFGP